MKTKLVILGMALSLITMGCDKDDNDNERGRVSQTDIQASAQIDNITDDVAEIARDYSNASVSGKTAGAETFIGNCASITTEQNGSVWVRTIDFGNTNCTLYNGNQVRGKIILTFNDDFNAQTRTISYAFDNFYHNDRHVEGNRTVVKVMVNGHPKATIDLDMTVTLPNGNVFTRTGQRVREFTNGYETVYLLDNEFTITGSWNTTNETTGVTYAATITAPILVKWNCAHIVSGVIGYTRSSDSATASLDYGDGECDAMATLTINGIPYQIVL